MKRMRTALAAIAALAASALVIPARAAPPTVTPSPGYDARLQEQRTATPVLPAPPPPSRKPPPKKRPQH